MMQARLVKAAWSPSPAIKAHANISLFMQALGLADVQALHAFSVTHVDTFWQKIIARLNIQFLQPPTEICNLSAGSESPRWLPGARMNIVDSCFNAPALAPAIIYNDLNQRLHTLTYAELNTLSQQIAASLQQQGFKAGDVLAIVMPMNHYTVAIYLGIIRMGGVVVSIADSFSSEEIATRLNIANAKAVFTQECFCWGGKEIALYAKITAAFAATIIVIPADHEVSVTLRSQDLAWQTFLCSKTSFTTHANDSMAPCHILFSSGTTGTPKAIVWNHTTPIKAASDAFFHHNLQPGDVCAWPTNLGWMMGPWLIFATLINQACLALFTETPKERAFGEFVQKAKVTMLGVVPTLVKQWRQTACMENLDWSHIKVFSSTGECSNADDMLYLMQLAGNKPVIEYCGGTEIGGAYLTSTVIQDNYPALFSTPALGMHIVILDETGKPGTCGEVAIIPPSMGLSTTLLNADHHQVYFANMPKIAEGLLRRHGDQVAQLANGYYCILGRVDDTMKLGGIKVSAAEIERALSDIPDIDEVAAIAFSPPGLGASQLIIYAATKTNLDKSTVLQTMQTHISTKLNPLFKIHDVIFITELPKTPSNKIMRRLLRDKLTR